MKSGFVSSTATFSSHVLLDAPFEMQVELRETEAFEQPVFPDADGSHVHPVMDIAEHLQSIVFHPLLHSVCGLRLCLLAIALVHAFPLHTSYDLDP
jgi:hypothetical protein